MSRSWPVRGPGQAAYERLRTAALAGTRLLDRDAARFERGGLRALIVEPVELPLFVPRLVEVERPPWTPYADPRLEALAEAYRLLAAAAACGAAVEAEG